MGKCLVWSFQSSTLRLSDELNWDACTGTDRDNTMPTFTGYMYVGHTCFQPRVRTYRYKGNKGGEVNFVNYECII
jgi:hypothetical protein